MRIATGWLLLSMTAIAAAQAPPCHDFGWDVQHERALFRAPPVQVRAATSAPSTPAVSLDRLYAVQLSPQTQIHYVSAPGKVALSDGAFGGLVKFRVPHEGSYRVSLDGPYWVDVVAKGSELATEDFSGQQGCALPRKMVIFEMPAGEDLWLQISSARSAQAHFTITAAPAAAASRPTSGH